MRTKLVDNKDLAGVRTRWSVACVRDFFNVFVVSRAILIAACDAVSYIAYG